MGCCGSHIHLHPPRPAAVTQLTAPCILHGGVQATSAEKSLAPPQRLLQGRNAAPCSDVDGLPVVTPWSPLDSPPVAVSAATAAAADGEATALAFDSMLGTPPTAATTMMEMAVMPALATEAQARSGCNCGLGASSGGVVQHSDGVGLPRDPPNEAMAPTPVVHECSAAWPPDGGAVLMARNGFAPAGAASPGLAGIAGSTPLRSQPWRGRMCCHAPLF